MPRGGAPVAFAWTGGLLMSRQERFEELYEANYPSIAGYVSRRTASIEDARDVVSETFLVAWRRLDEVPAGDAARLWLYGTARRVLANQHRGARRRERLLRRLEVDAGVPAWLPSSSSDGEIEAIVTAFSGLRPADREVLLLAGWEELDAAQLAVVLGCRAATATVRLHRARRRFASQLESQGVQDLARSGHVPGKQAIVRLDPEEAQ
jgi:RNA polymerase sigma factor (sigma-70 family)